MMIYFSLVGAVAPRPVVVVGIGVVVVWAEEGASVVVEEEEGPVVVPFLSSANL